MRDPGTERSRPLFTEKELRIARLVCEELSYSEISRREGCSPRTVETHVRNIASKCGCVVDGGARTVRHYFGDGFMPLRAITDGAAIP